MSTNPEECVNPQEYVRFGDSAAVRCIDGGTQSNSRFANLVLASQIG
ncbi:MAG: hypothetical protein JWO96_678 [Candidatus Saccharibacteria bacterium]|nr:hypothetical protein [Candidatus Saccharibacteria bacterium]